MHQPIEIDELIHYVALDGSDVQVTMFVEYMNETWFPKWKNNYNITDIQFDLGSDTMSFITGNTSESLLLNIMDISVMFPSALINYAYYSSTDDIYSDDYEDNSYFIMNGKIIKDMPFAS